ncbi:MAG: 30S ribosomal protein S20, partial [Proteobacteria bacterium]|nr:30S ribosomal protein S20 [Pseudomonadota bacterium]
MANTAAAKKALKVSQNKESINKARKNRIRTFIKKAEAQIEAKKEKEAREAFKVVEKEIMRGVTKGVYKLNTAARKLRRLAAAIRKIAETKPEKA